MKLLLHTCCAPCSVYCIEELKKDNTDITSFWYNPNIHPYKEYEARLKTLKAYNKKMKIPLIIDDYYGLREFCKNVVDKLDNRCGYCYLCRLEKTAKYAYENNYDAFSTTLLISPYQNHEMLKKTGKLLEKKYNIKFLYKDFREGFVYGRQKARDLGLYMQKYCGCIFSEDERYNNYNISKPILSKEYEIPRTKRLKVKRVENIDKCINYFLDKKLIEQDTINLEEKLFAYKLELKDEPVSIAIISKLDKKALELKYIFTKENYRNRGYAKTLLKSLCGNYKQKYNKMLVCSDETNIPFFVKQGFDIYEKTIKNKNLICYFKNLNKDI